MKKLFASLLIFASLLAPLLTVPGAVYALDVFSQACAVSGASSSAVCQSDNNNDSGSLLVDTLKTIFNILSFVIGVAAIIMLVVGGMKLISSGGDASNVKSGRDTIIYSLVGLAVAALAQVIVVFVLNKLS